MENGGLGVSLNKKICKTILIIIIYNLIYNYNNYVQNIKPMFSCLK